MVHANITQTSVRLSLHSVTAKTPCTEHDSAEVIHQLEMFCNQNLATPENMNHEGIAGSKRDRCDAKEKRKA